MDMSATDSVARQIRDGAVQEGAAPCSEERIATARSKLLGLRRSSTR
jgi:hypothetical protein